MISQVVQNSTAWSEERQKRVQVSRIYSDGFLYLEGDPWPWIVLNHADCHSVRSLELDLRGYYDVETIGDSVAELAELTQLSIYGGVSLKCASNVVMLHNLKVLKIKNCGHLEGLPENLGELRNLTHLQLSNCSSIKSLPNTIAELSKLSSLKVEDCESLATLPAAFNVLELRLHNCCRIQFFPRGLTKVESLDLQLCSFSKERFSSLMDAKRLRQLTISVCGIHPVTEMPANLNEFVSLETLTIQCYLNKNLPSFAVPRSLQRLYLNLRVEEFPIISDDLPQLLHLDIHQCDSLRYLPYNIKNLLNLQFLHLPSDFRLEALPFDLSDDVIISLEGKHIRKTWEELKLDMGPLFLRASPPVVEMVMEAPQNRSPLFASGYLSLKEDPSSRILTHPNLVRILDLKLPDTADEIGDVIGVLPNLTHLYILRGNHLSCLPDTITRLTHLSLHGCNLHRLYGSMVKLSNLKSLDLCLLETQLPAEMDLLFCLEHLTLRNYHYSLPDSVAKLSNLNTLEVYCCNGMSFPENLKLTKLKLVCCSLELLIPSLCHLEIVHDKGYCSNECGDDSKMCLKQLVNLKTLSLTCYRVKFLPSIAVLQNLQTLLFKDCSSLRELMPNMAESVELCTLNISGTKIKSFSECIMKLPKLQHLILPNCFKRKNMPPQILRNGSILKIRFDGNDESLTETSDEDKEIQADSVEELDDVFWRELVKEGIIDVQTSSSRLPKSPEATQGLGDFRISGNNHHASGCAQNQETENLSSGFHSMDIVADTIPTLSCNFQEINNFGEDSQMGTRNLGNEESIITSSHQLISSSFADDGSTHHDVDNLNNPHGSRKKSNRRKKEITREAIQSLRDETMSLNAASQKLGVSRSTLKRLCKEHRLGQWPSSRKKKSNTKSSSRGKLSQPNLVKCTNPPCPTYVNECSDNPHNLPDQVAPECDSIDNSTPKATTESVGELNAATHRSMHIHESVPMCMVGTEIVSLSSNAQGSSSSSSFEIKATYKEDIVRFKWSPIACLKELKEAVVENLKVEVDSFKLKYLDEEEDWVLINTNEHLQRALSLIKDNILRLKVLDS